MQYRIIALAGALALGISISPLPAAGAEPLKVGDAAPEAASVDQDGKPVSLSGLYGSGWTLVYFYPKADTPGCTAEACSLRDAFADLTKKGVTVIGVSADKPAEQKAFRENITYLSRCSPTRQARHPGVRRSDDDGIRQPPVLPDQGRQDRLARPPRIDEGTGRRHPGKRSPPAENRPGNGDPPRIVAASPGRRRPASSSC